MSRARGDIDPAREVVSEKRNRRRKKRNRPDPNPINKEAEPDTLRALQSLPVPPGVMFEPEGERGYLLTSPHNDLDLWEKQIAAAFGTRSTSVCRVFMGELKKLCRKDWDEAAGRWKRDETELNAALSMVNDWQPENTAQAALAAQMVAVHWMVMRLSAQALNNGHMVIETDANLAGKLSRTFAQLCETMQGLKGKSRTAKQSITVKRESHHHQHIHVHRDGGGEENGGQVHEPRGEAAARIIDQRDPMRGDDESGVVLPLSRATR